MNLVGFLLGFHPRCFSGLWRRKRSIWCFHIIILPRCLYYHSEQMQQKTFLQAVLVVVELSTKGLPSAALESSPRVLTWRRGLVCLCVSVCAHTASACVLWLLLARAGQGFLFLWLLPRQSRVEILSSLFLSCSATWTFTRKLGAISSPLASSPACYSRFLPALSLFLAILVIFVSLSPPLPFYAWYLSLLPAFFFEQLPLWQNHRLSSSSVNLSTTVIHSVIHRLKIQRH